jgi:hypothetical protein
MAPKQIPESLVTAYRDAGERLRGLQADATKRVQDAMSATPGWQAASKAAAAHAVLVASTGETESALSELLRAYVDAGERDPAAVAHQVRKEFLAGLSVPGHGFFEGSAADAAALAPAALRHAAEFDAWRDALAAGIPERFRRALEAHPSQRQGLGARPSTRSLGENHAVLGFLLLTAAMSICGLSWLDVARKTLALF